MENTENNKQVAMGLGAKIGVLASTQGVTQTSLAENCQISRISINRFFRGRSEIRASDLVRVLQTLGIDLNQEIERKLGLNIYPQLPR